MKQLLSSNAVILFASIAAVFVLGGCSPLPVVHIQERPIPAQDKVQFTDQRVATEQPSFMFGEGLITSCHYAIERDKDTILDPDGMSLLHAYLSNEVLNDGQPHTVIVARFEIYTNRQVPVLHDAWGDMYRPGPLVGCQDADQGEYFLSEIPPSARPTPIVIYLYTVIDGKEHKIRSLYPFESNEDASVSSARWPAALTSALQKTFAALAQSIKE